jgi:hypothetical protein
MPNIICFGLNISVSERSGDGWHREEIERGNVGRWRGGHPWARLAEMG